MARRDGLQSHSSPKASRAIFRAFQVSDVVMEEKMGFEAAMSAPTEIAKMLDLQNGEISRDRS